jgi:hypothetical protein
MNRLIPILKSRIFIIVVSVILLYTLFGFFLVPYLVQHYVPRIVYENFEKDAVIGDVHFNPYFFTLETNDFHIEELDGRPILGFNYLLVNFELKSLFKWAWTFKRIEFLEPYLNAIITPNGTLNLLQFTQASEEPPPEEQDESLPRLIIEHLVINQGNIHFTDQRQTKPANVHFIPLNLDIENLSTLPEKEGFKHITATTRDGENFQWTGNISLDPFSTSGTLLFENIHASTLWSFTRDSLNLEAPTGKLSITSDYHFDLSDIEPKLTLTKFFGSLNNLKLTITGNSEPFLELPETKIIASRFHLTEQQGIIDKLTVTGGAARLAVDETGVLNLENIIKSSDVPLPLDRHKPSPTKPWEIKVSAFNLSEFLLNYQDESRSPGLKARIDRIKIGLKAKAEVGNDQPKVLINEIAADLSGISAGLAHTPEPEIKLDKLILDGGTYDLVPNNFTSEKISISGGKIDLKRQEDGVINLTLFAEPPEKGLVAKEIMDVEAEGHPIQFLVKIIVLSGLETTFTDLSVHPDDPIINIEDISVILNNVDGKSPTTFDLELKIQEGGQIKAEGIINPALPSVESEIKVSSVGLTPFQPYLEQAASLVLKSAEVSTQGSFQYGLKGAGAQTTYDGKLKLINLHLVEPEGDETFLEWKTLQTDQLQFHLEPNRIEIGELELAQLVGKFIIYEDQTINIFKVIKADSDSDTEPSALAGLDDNAADLFPVYVRRLTISNGQVEFADLSMTPQFGTRIHELEGFVTDISTEPEVLAQIELDGLVDEYGTAQIEGELNISDPKEYTNINMIFRNVEMTKLTPYSGRFAGREIDSGRLSVDLNYDIRDNRLMGDNQIIVEQLELGDRVESPDAINLPLDLAIALLEDRHGLINIGLPVRGDLDSPEFSFGAIIWRAFTNLVSQIATSPFRALGALIPGLGEEETLDIIVFEPGKSTIPPPEQEKLAELANALQNRPRLELTIQGRYNPEMDLAELRAASLRRTIAISQGQDLERDEDPGRVDFNNPDVQNILEAMVEATFGPYTLNAIKEEFKETNENIEDRRKKVDRAELSEKLFELLADIEPIGITELVRLADARSQAVMEKVRESKRISPERIGIEPSAAQDREDLPTALLNLEVIR